MEKVTFRFNRGCQSYLYDCYVLADGFKPIRFFEDAFFGDVVCALSFLTNQANWDFIEDVEFAEHLLQIAKRADYTFIFPVCDVSDFMNYIINIVKRADNED